MGLSHSRCSGFVGQRLRNGHALLSARKLKAGRPRPYLQGPQGLKVLHARGRILPVVPLFQFQGKGQCPRPLFSASAGYSPETRRPFYALARRSASPERGRQGRCPAARGPAWAFPAQTSTAGFARAGHADDAEHLAVSTRRLTSSSATTRGAAVCEHFCEVLNVYQRFSRSFPLSNKTPLKLSLQGR